MNEPIIFQDEGTVYYADTCVPLKRAAASGERLPEDVMPEVRSVGVWDARRRQAWGLDMHCNEGIELTYVARGQVAFQVEGAAYSLRKGSIGITRPWQFHRLGDPFVTASRLYWLILDVGVRRPHQEWTFPPWLVCSAHDLKRLSDRLRQNDQPVWRANDEIALAFTRLGDLLSAPAGGGETRLALTINELIVALMDVLERQSVALDSHLSSIQRTVELFLTRLPDHLAYDWDLMSMARQCSLSRSQFAHYCKQITQMTPIEYLTACRVEAAARALAEMPGRSVTEIAFACGFNSSQYFATVFRAYRGCTPTDYRERVAPGGGEAA